MAYMTLIYNSHIVLIPVISAHSNFNIEEQLVTKNSKLKNRNL